MKDSLSRALAALLFSGVKPFNAILEEGIMGNIHVKLFFLNLDQGFRRRCHLKEKFTDTRWTKTDHNSSSNA